MKHGGAGGGEGGAASGAAVSPPRATLIFPALAGALRSTVGILARKSNVKGNLKACLWLTLLLSLGFVSLCCVYLALQAAVFLCQDRRQFTYHFRYCWSQLRARPQNATCLLAGVAGAGEFLLLIWSSTMEPELSVALIMTVAIQLLLLLALAGDAFAICWMPYHVPSEPTFLGGVFAFMGLLLVQALGLDFGGSSWILWRYLMATGAGVFAFFSLALARQASSCFASYWAGTATNAVGQAVILAILAFSFDPGREYAAQATDLFKDGSQTALYVLSSIGLYVGFACVQFYGDIGGYYSAYAPLAAALVVLPLCMELASSSYELGSVGEIAYRPTVSLVVAMIFLLGGALLMWLGRWAGAAGEAAAIAEDESPTALAAAAAAAAAGGPADRSAATAAGAAGGGGDLTAPSAGQQPSSAPPPHGTLPGAKSTTAAAGASGAAPAIPPIPLSEPLRPLRRKVGSSLLSTFDTARQMALFQHPAAGKPILPPKPRKQPLLDERAMFVVTPSKMIHPGQAGGGSSASSASSAAGPGGRAASARDASLHPPAYRDPSSLV